MRGDSGQPIIVATSALLSKLEKAGLEDTRSMNWSTRDEEQETYAQGDSGMYTTQELRLIQSVRALLQGIGEDVSRNGLLKTPHRVARAFLSATAGYGTSAESILQEALFTESGPESGWLTEVGGGGGGSGGMVVVRDIDLFPTCESCLLPFRVCCHIAYIPSKQRVVGLSKLPRVAEVYASRLQNPERLVKDIAAGLSEGFYPVGVAVLAECWHLKWPQGCGHTGVEPVDWSRRTVRFGQGDFGNRSSGLWDEFLAMLQLVGKDVDLSDLKPVSCPLMVSTTTAAGKLSNGLSVKPKASNLEAMVQAVRSLLEALGEDPDREELKQTPLCYVHWLLASTQGSRGCLDNGKLMGGFAEVHVAAGGLRTVLDLPFCSQCEHHLLPFSGVAHVGYLVEAGKQQEFQWDKLSLQMILKLFSCRLQVQERLTKQIAEAVMSSSSSSGVVGVMVVLEASHICMISRGIKKVGSSTATMATLGEFASNVKARTEFLHRISARR